MKQQNGSKFGKEYVKAVYCMMLIYLLPGGLEGKASACNAGEPGSIPESGRSPGEGNSIPLQYSCLENPMDRGTWEAAAHGVAKSWTQLSDFTFLSFPFYIFLRFRVHQVYCQVG